MFNTAGGMFLKKISPQRIFFQIKPCRGLFFINPPEAKNQIPPEAKISTSL
jgi:hypothetical protein